MSAKNLSIRAVVAFIVAPLVIFVVFQDLVNVEETLSLILFALVLAAVSFVLGLLLINNPIKKEDQASAQRLLILTVVISIVWFLAAVVLRTPPA